MGRKAIGNGPHEEIPFEPTEETAPARAGTRAARSRWSRTPIAWATAWGVSLAGAGLACSTLLTPLYAMALGEQPGNLGPLPGLLFWGPAGLFGGFLAGLATASLLSKEEDVVTCLKTVAVTYSLAATVMPVALAW